MQKNNFFLIILLCISLTNCEEEAHKYPLNKRYWDLNDYDKAILELRFGYEDDEEKPKFNNADRLVVQKLTDEQNFKVVTDDNELGIKHRSNVATEFFDHWKDMTKIYQITNRKDEYLYDIEMLAVWQFGLSLQLDYFKLGNDVIMETADDPDSSRIVNLLNSNINVLIDNYTYYLDEINNEKSFSNEGLVKLAEGIDENFSELIDLFPKGNYSGMRKKAELMLEKSNSDIVKSSLNNLIKLIDSKKEEENNSSEE